MKSEFEIRGMIWAFEEEQRIHADDKKLVLGLNIPIKALKWVLEEDPKSEYLKKYLKEVKQ